MPPRHHDQHGKAQNMHDSPCSYVVIKCMMMFTLHKHIRNCVVIGFMVTGIIKFFNFEWQLGKIHPQLNCIHEYWLKECM